MKLFRRWACPSRPCAAGRHRAGWPPSTRRAAILNQGEDTTFEEDLAKDVLEIITVFSARLCASRSRKNQKLLDGVRQAVEASQC